MMRKIIGALLAATLLPAAAQTQTPAPASAATPPAAEAPKPRPQLRLQLDEKDMRSVMTLTPTDGEKKQDSGLPTLGGDSPPIPERKPSDVVPKGM